jgi:hypothetical protein
MPASRHEGGKCAHDNREGEELRRQAAEIDPDTETPE